MKILKINPSLAHGSIRVPSSKSYIHRYLIMACLLNKHTIIDNVDLNDDIKATMDCLITLGAHIKYQNKQLIILEGLKKQNKVILNANESGSTLRFLIPLATLFSNETYFRGSKKLLSRPLKDYDSFFQIIYINDTLIQIIPIIKKTKPLAINANVSSQFITGMLFYLLAQNKQDKLILKNKIVSRNYILITLKVLNFFGIQTTFDCNCITYNNQNQCENYIVNAPLDYSQAAFWLVLKTTNPNIIIDNLKDDKTQGDSVIIDIINNLANIDTIDLLNCPDLAPILIVLGIINNHLFKFMNSKRLIWKESNRIKAMQANILQLGYDLIIENDSFEIIKIANYQNNNSYYFFKTFNDHRIFMALAILATTLDKPSYFDNYKCVNKSYPQFIDDLKQLNIKVEEVDKNATLSN